MAVGRYAVVCNSHRTALAACLHLRAAHLA
jgi:hypothetical protein